MRKLIKISDKVEAGYLCKDEKPRTKYPESQEANEKQKSFQHQGEKEENYLGTETCQKLLEIYKEKKKQGGIQTFIMILNSEASKENETKTT